MESFTAAVKKMFQCRLTDMRVKASDTVDLGAELPRKRLVGTKTRLLLSHHLTGAGIGLS